MEKHKPTRKSAHRKAREGKKKFRALIDTYSKQHKLSEADRLIFQELLGLGKLTNIKLASDMDLRIKAGSFLGDALAALFENNPKLSFLFWTFTHDLGNTSDRNPELDLKALQVKIDGVFRSLCLPSFSVVELQGLGNHPREGNGRMIMANGHAITWSEKPIDRKLVQAELNSSAAWHNELNETPIVIKEVRPTVGDLHYLAYYMFKPPYDVKMMEDRKAGLRMKTTEKGYKPEFAVRILEGLAQLELLRLIRSTADGSAIRSDWQRRLGHWHKSRLNWSNEKVLGVDLTAFWDGVRNKKRRVAYRPYLIRR